MSYLFQSRQLHPRYCGLGLGTVGRGLGLVGPDQPWTSANAGKVIQQPTRNCPSGSKTKKSSEFAVPKAEIGGEVVPDTECFQTGKVWEARRAGNNRMVEWCCPVREYLPHRVITQPEYEQWKDRCGPKRSPQGTVYETYPEWRDAESYVGSTCDRTNIFDEGYELVCCPQRSHSGSLALTLPDMPFMHAEATPEQEAEWEARREERQTEQAAAAAAAAPPPATFIERYGFALLLVGGAVGLGVTAALFKRFSVAAKKAEESKAAIAQLQAQQGEA
jgi:hypothetical protein